MTHPAERISNLLLLSELDRHHLALEWNDTAADHPAYNSVKDMFEQEARRRPDAVAVEMRGEQVSYGELNRRANRLGRYLRSKGVGVESKVGICVDRSIEMVVAVMGVLKAGGAYVPMDPSYPQERLTYMKDDAGIKLLLTKTGLADWFDADESQIFYLDKDWHKVVSHNDENLSNGTLPENLAYMIYTSGSTGRPKGVLLEHGALCNLVEAQIEAFDVKATSRVLQFASFSFDASVSEIFVTLASGATLCLTTGDSLLPDSELAALLRNEAITVVTMPPSALAVLPAEDLPGLKTVVSAGEPCSTEIMQRWAAEHKFINAYGPTEATVCATLEVCDINRNPSIGRPIANTQVYLLDKHLQQVAVGVVGELYIAGAGLARGYWQNEEMTAARFVPNPFSTRAGERMYRTGDIGRYLPDGRIGYLGRVDNQVKIRGYRVELAEVEAVLSRHEQVSGCAVVAAEPEPGHKQLVAYFAKRKPYESVSGDLGRKHTSLNNGSHELWPSVAEYFIYDEVLYYAMVNDKSRNRAFRAAIEESVKDKVVVDIGTGPEAHLAKMCLEAGAKRVYSIEILESVYNQARDYIKSLGLENRIILMQGDSTKVTLPEPADVCVSGIVGSIGGSEGAVLILNDARRFLKPDGRMIPQRSITKIAAVAIPDDFLTDPGFTESTRNYVEKIFEQTGYMFDLRLCVRGLDENLPDVRR